MTNADTQLNRCQCCGAEILSLGDITLGDLCDKCVGNPIRQDYYANMKLLSDKEEISDEEIILTLGSTVKHDNSNKVITFLNIVCNYTDEDQANLGFLAASSTGKSYLPIEIGTGYFPESDLMIVGYCSPTAFFHEHGTLLPDPTDDRNEEPEKKRKVRYIDLHQKIIIFLDQPHAKLLENLRPLLSHDQKKIILKITNKSEKAGNRAETIVIEGYPTVVFCSANYKQDEQEKTRLLLLSPEVTQEKLRETIALKIEKDGNRLLFKRKLSKNPDRIRFSARIENLRHAKINQVIIPQELQALIYQKFIESHPILQARNQRDIGRLHNIIKGHALLNFYERNLHSEFYRDKTGTLESDPITAIIVQLKDVEIGFKYYGTVAEANELGLPPEVYQIYQTFRTEMVNGFTRRDFQSMYFRKFRKPCGRSKASGFIEMLEQTGLIVQDEDNPDRKTKHYKLADMCAEGVGADNIEHSNMQTPPPEHTYSNQGELRCGSCDNFRKPSCQYNNWGKRDENELAIGYRCYKKRRRVANAEGSCYLS
jgi:hypothetical protein